MIMSFKNFAKVPNFGKVEIRKKSYRIENKTAIRIQNRAYG